MMSTANNEEQHIIVIDNSECIKNLWASVSRACFIDGPDGTGKTFVYQCLIQSCIC